MTGVPSGNILPLVSLKIFVHIFKGAIKSGGCFGSLIYTVIPSLF